MWACDLGYPNVHWPHPISFRIVTLFFILEPDFVEPPQTAVGATYRLVLGRGEQGEGTSDYATAVSRLPPPSSLLPQRRRAMAIS